jgi:hypothetical protein
MHYCFYQIKVSCLPCNLFVFSPFFPNHDYRSSICQFQTQRLAAIIVFYQNDDGDYQYFPYFSRMLKKAKISQNSWWILEGENIARKKDNFSPLTTRQIHSASGISFYQSR